MHTGWAEVGEYDVSRARDYAKECTVKVLTSSNFAMFERNIELDQWFAPLVDDVPG